MKPPAGQGHLPWQFFWYIDTQCMVMSQLVINHNFSQNISNWEKKRKMPNLIGLKEYYPMLIIELYKLIFSCTLQIRSSLLNRSIELCFFTHLYIYFPFLPFSQQLCERSLWKAYRFLECKYSRLLGPNYYTSHHPFTIRFNSSSFKM